MTWRGPFSALSRGAVIAGAIGFFAMTALIAAIGAPLRVDGGASIKAFEFAGTAAHAAAIIDGWNASQRLLAAFHTGIDFVYIVIYTLGLSAWLSFLAKATTPSWVSVIGAILAWAMLFAGGLDAIENVALITQLVRGTDDNLATIAKDAAIAKFAIAYTAAAYLLIGSGWLMLSRKKRLA